jgi:hypothetical protein
MEAINAIAVHSNWINFIVPGAYLTGNFTPWLNSMRDVETFSLALVSHSCLREFLEQLLLKDPRPSVLGLVKNQSSKERTIFVRKLMGNCEIAMGGACSGKTADFNTPNPWVFFVYAYAYQRSI